jgi:hypothetical protein
VIDAERLYTVDNSAILGAFDLQTGKELWTKRLGTLQKSSPILADGKLYVGTENGKFFILRPSATGAETLDEDQIGSPTNPEPILASPAVADGRIYVVTMAPVQDVKGSSGHVYAIGARKPRAAGAKPAGPAANPPMSLGTAAQVQVFPNEVMLDPGGKQAFTVKLFDAKGDLLRAASPTDVQWTLDLLQGAVGPDGTYAAPASGGSAGFVKATIGGVSGQARVRVIPPLPQSLDFEGLKAAPAWWTANLKGTITQVDGSTVLTRPRDDTVARRTRFIMGRPDWSNYTVEADVRGVEMRRQRGDAGLVNQRYAMVLFGNSQHLELHPWQAADEMTVQVPFKWDVNTWYRMKLRVENRADGTTLVQGKVWLTGQPEPAAWTITKTDTIPHRKGAPGLYGDGISDIHFDNVRVYRNQ